MSEGSLQTAAQLLKPELRSLREQLNKFLSSADMNSIVAAKTMMEGVELLGSETAQIANDEHIDVAVGIVGPCRNRSEDPDVCGVDAIGHVA